MNTLIIGGNKFFGKRLAQLLIENGHNVTLLNRGNTDDQLGNSISRIVCDRNDKDAMKEVLKGKSFDLVFDQICYDYITAENSCEIFKDKTKRYIFTSTKSVYGPGENLKENIFSPHRHEFERHETWQTDYGEAKRQAETAFIRHSSFPVAMLRFPFVLGEEDPTERLNWHVNRVKEGKPIYLPSPNSKVNFIHARDAARTLYEVGLSSFEGPLNSAGANPMVLRDLISLIENKYDKKANLLTEKSENDWSPYGVSEDWWMNIDLMKSKFFTPDSPEIWLPELI